MTCGIEFQNQTIRINTEKGTEKCLIQVWRILSRANNQDLQVRYMMGSAAVVIFLNNNLHSNLEPLNEYLDLVEKVDNSSKFLTYVVIVAKGGETIDLCQFSKNLSERYPRLRIKVYYSPMLGKSDLNFIYQDAAEHAVRHECATVLTYLEDDSSDGNKKFPLSFP